MEYDRWIHETKTGSRMKIWEMSDEHLGRMIRLMLRQMQEAQGLADGTFSKFQRAIYRIDDSHIERRIQFFMDKFPSYLTEAVLRGYDLAEVTEQLQTIFGRTGPMTAQRLLTSDIVEPDDWEEDEPDERGEEPT